MYYRGQAIQIPGGILVVMAPLASVYAALSDLVHVELLVSFIVLLLMIVISFWVVRIGLAPLNSIRETADEIAGGNLGKRISVSRENTEVSSLAVALNGMLDQIEMSFKESSLAQDRLRQFMADVSHDLRTPLTSIRGYAQLLSKGALSDPGERNQAVERISNEAQRMTLLVNDLMLLARLDQDRPINAVDTDMNEIVTEAVNAARAVYPDREIDVIAQGNTILFGDAERLRQVVDNLLHNAAVHTPPGTPIHVSLVESSGSLVLSVIDEGYGLNASELQDVFDRFHKGSRTDDSHGMGLGLSIVAAIAAAHGGRAWAESPVWTNRVGSEPSPERLPGAAFRVAIPIR
jgi:two-component system OmpR family sensor kinase